MESTQNLKKRLKSVGNINKITKAMELVAATKMRKSQEIALSGRPYAFAALDLLANVSLLETELPKLFKKNRTGKTLFVLVASDKGLAGAFNSSLFRKFETFLKKDSSSEALSTEAFSSSFAKASESKNNTSEFIAVGEKTFGYLSKKRFPVVKKFTNVGDFTTPAQVRPLAEFLAEGYIKKEWSKVLLFSTHFMSALKQEPLMREILPIRFDSIKKTIEEITPTAGKFADIMKEQKLSFSGEKNIKEYLVEPSSKKVLDRLAKHLFFMQVYHIILEANASEHSARRMAMKTASDNASELSENLNLEYNKSRQAAITKEIIEITAGSESLNQ